MRAANLAVGLGFLGVMLPAAISYGDCIDYGEYLHCVGATGTPGACYAVAVSGDYAYATQVHISPGLVVIDVADPQHPRVRGSVPLNWPSDVVVTGSIALASSENGLHTIDIRKPDAPTIISSLGLPTRAWGIQIVGSLAYVCDGPAGLYVIDITDPAQLQIVGSVDTPNHAYAVAVAGTLAYVADAGGGLQVVDVADPTLPQLIGSVAVTHAVDLAVVGNYAFVVDRLGSSLVVVDLTDPTHPQVVSEFAALASPYKLAVHGTLAYLTAEGQLNGIMVIDISDPLQPSLVGWQAMSSVNDIAVTDRGLGYAAASWAFRVLDITNPECAPVFAEVSAFSGEPGYGLVVADRYAYVAAGLDLRIVDVADPAAPVIVSSLDTAARDVVVSGTCAYVVDEEALKIVDVGRPTDPRLLGTVDTPGEAMRLVVAGEHAYVADGLAGLTVIDIIEPDAPRIVGQFDTPGIAQDLVVVGSLAYVVERYSGLQVIDIADPEHPQLVGSLATPGEFSGVAVDGPRAFIAAGSRGLLVVDVAEPTCPALIAGVRLVSGESSQVTVKGGFAYVAEGPCGFEVVDISVPEAPIIVGGISTTSSITDVTTDGDYVFALEARGSSPNIDTALLVLQPQCTPTSAPAAPDLAQGRLVAFPNPTVAQSVIRLAPATAGPIQATVYDVGGRRVRRLLNAVGGPVPCDLTWDGRDDKGQAVAPGVYLVRVTAGEIVRSARVVILR